MTDAEELHVLVGNPFRWNTSEEARVRELIRKLVPAPPTTVDHGTPLPFHCDNCKADHEYVLLDGYHFGGRQLEGVRFEVRRYADNTWTVTLPEDYQYALYGLDEELWLARGASYAPQRDNLRLTQVP
jgi:hypothetical protein